MAGGGQGTETMASRRLLIPPTLGDGGGGSGEANCGGGCMDTLCVHAERRQKRIVGTKHRARPEGHFWTEVVTSI